MGVVTEEKDMAVRKAIRPSLRIAAGVLVGAVVLAACGSSSSSGSSGPAASSGAHKKGGTAIWAEPPQATPNWIFPFASLTYFSVANLTEFQYLMFRPLYWFGPPTSQAPTVDYSLSLADAPTWSNGDKSVTVKLKGWKYSNGTTVDAQSVMFWMNMLKAEKLNWAGYAPGGFPDNVVSYTANTKADTVTFNLNAKYSTTWYLYNELSQITPLPVAWDITRAGAAPGSGGCSSDTPSARVLNDCKKVWAFLTDDNGHKKNPTEGADLATYATNPLWQIADGPWRLKAFTTTGEATFVPNTKYSGPQKPILSKFIEMPYTSDSSEYDALAAGGANAPDVGYVPTEDILNAHTGKLGSAGPNTSALSSGYTLDPEYDWGIDYAADNFNSNGDGGNAGPIFKQLYVRQAIQMTINQRQIIKDVDKGYGVPTYGPVPAYPKNSFVSSSESKNPYPYDPKKAKKLLSSHGWTVMANGTDVCDVGAKCGTGIKNGASMSFTMLYYSGPQNIYQTVLAEVSSLRSIGIHINLQGTTFDNVLTTAIPCSYHSSSCAWELAFWGGGWVYSPDYLPTGEEIFETGAGSNSGSYNSTENNTLIRKTNLSSASKYLDQYQDYLADNLPVIWEPNPATALGEISDRLGGVTPVNSLLNLTPEYWYLRS